MDESYVVHCYSVVCIRSSCDPFDLADPKASFREAITRLKTMFESCNLDVAHPCTADNERDCWIFSHLTLWNRVLHPLRVLLIEKNPFHLSLSSSYGFDYHLFDEDSALQGSVAVHWLLKEHHCIRTVSIKKGYDLYWNPLFCNALFVSKAVKKLKLSYDDKSFYHDDMKLAAAVANMPCLEKLCLEGALSRRDSFSIVGNGIGSKNTLVELKVRTIRFAPSSAVPILSGAKSFTNLRYLHLETEKLKIKGARRLSDTLRNNRGLEKLELVLIEFTNDELCTIAEGLSAYPLLKLKEFEMFYCYFHASAFSMLIAALQQHQSLTSLRIVACRLDCNKVRVLVHLLKDFAHLRELCLDQNNIKDDGAVALSNCLAVVRELEVISLKQNLLTSRGVITLVRSLLQHTANTLLYLGDVGVNDNEAHNVFRALDQDGAFDRVQIVYHADGIPQLIRVVQANRYRIEEIGFGKLSLGHQYVHELLSALSNNCSVKRLTLEGTLVDDRLAQELYPFLSANKTLKYLAVGKVDRLSSLILLCQGLAENTSISRLRIGSCDRFGSDSTRAFAAMLKANKTLNELSIWAYDVERIRPGLSENYTLTELSLGWPYNENALYVAEVFCRNYRTLNKAVKFVSMKSSDRSLALAFEKVRYSDSLLRQLRKYSGHSEAEVKTSVKRASRYILDDFPVLSGIVREKLECHRNDLNMTQIDQLCADCLAKLFSYVNLEDVIQA